MKLKFTFLFPLLIVIAATSCKQKGSDGSQASGGTAIPDSVLVPVAEAKLYVKNYAAHAGYVDDSTDVVGIGGGKPVRKKPDTRCIWFSKERLTSMLKQLESEGGTGVRFYLATYNKKYIPGPNERGGHHPPKPYWGYNTLIMVSTKDTTVQISPKESLLIHKDYYKDLNPNLMSSSNKSKKGFIVGFEPENRGELCPPPENCFVVGATLLPDN